MTATTHHIPIPAKQDVLAHSDNPAIRFIKRQAVEDITGLSCTEIYRRIAADNFPKQVSLGPKCVVWVEDEIYVWMSDRISESLKVAA